MKTFLWIAGAVFLSALVGWSLLQQARRPETKGQRLIRALEATQPLRGAVPLETAAPLAAGAAPITAQARWLDDHTQAFEGEGFRVVVVRQSVPLFRPLIEDANIGLTLEKALRRMGYVMDKPADLVAAARAVLRAMSDEELLRAFLQADVATLEECNDEALAVEQALLLVAWQPRGAAAADCAGGRVYAVEVGAAPAGSEPEVTLLRVNAAGIEQWHGTLWMKSGPQTPEAMSILLQLLPQIDAGR